MLLAVSVSLCELTNVNAPVLLVVAPNVISVGVSNVVKGVDPKLGEVKALASCNV